MHLQGDLEVFMMSENVFSTGICGRRATETSPFIPEAQK